MNHNLRQIIYDMRTQPVIAWVTIIGTALSIFLIMTVVMLQQVYLIPFSPESHRDRMLYGCFFHVKGTENGNEMSGSLNYSRARQLYGDLEGIDAVSYMVKDAASVDLKGSADMAFSGYAKQTDDAFWRIYDFELLAGRYYTPEEVAANTRVAVVGESMGRRLFDGENPVGRHFTINHRDYEVIGVVGDVSKLATMAFGEVFVPINTENQWHDQGLGPFCAAMLMSPGADPEAIRTQVRARYAHAETELASEGYEPVYHGAPFDQETIADGVEGSNVTPDPSANRIMYAIIYTILLLVPAINLSSMLHSRIRRRISDIGVRRAFGCTRRRIVADIIAENLIVTVAGGIVGLTAGILFAMFYDGLYTGGDGESVRPALSVLLNFRIIGIAFLACFVLNLVSASIPAVQAARVNPVDAINAK